MRTVAVTLGLGLAGVVFGCAGAAPDAMEPASPDKGWEAAAETFGAVRAGDVQIDRAHYESAVEMLRGMAPGVQVVTTGNAVELRIRGMHQSLGGASGQGPLVMIDGMPSSAGTLFGLNPTDVVKVTVLKDVASTVIYGTKAANGVILVQTRRKK